MLLGPVLAAVALATVTLSTDESCVRAHYELSDATTIFKFSERAAVQRKANWSPVDQGWYFDGLKIARVNGEQFQQFTLCLAPDREFVNRRYVAIDRVGDAGWFVYLTALGAEQGILTQVMVDELPSDWIYRLNHQTLNRPWPKVTLNDQDQIAYIGPSRFLHRSAHDQDLIIIAGPEVPRWLMAHLQDNVLKVVAGLTSRLGVAPDKSPTLLISYQQQPNIRSWKGGVLDDGVIAFRLRGIPLQQDDESVRNDLINIAAHEAAHLWVGDKFQSSQNEQQPWLQEGGAEYLADRLWMDGKGFIKEAELRLNECVLGLGERGLDGAETVVQDMSAYDCGFVMQLAAEAAAWHNRGADGSYTDPEADIFHLWRAVLTADENPQFSPDEFIAEATRRGGSAFSDIAELLLRADSAARWAPLTALLGFIGVDVQPRDADQREQRHILTRFLWPLMAGECSPGYGFRTDRDGHVTLNTDHCEGALAGSPRIEAINGVSLATAAFSTHRTVRDTCQNGGELVLTVVNEAVPRRLMCRLRIAPLPQLYEIRRLGFISAANSGVNR